MAFDLQPTSTHVLPHRTGGTLRSLRPLLSFAAALVGLTTAPMPLRAQFPPELQVGARVRVWLPEPYRQAEGPVRRQLLRGTIAGVSADTLRLSFRGAMGAIAIPRASVRRLEVSGGVSRPTSAVERAVGGAIGGAVSWALLNDPRRRGGPHYRTDWGAAGVGASWGASIAALTGFVFPHERWRRVRLRH
jgi:hypothetical protein